jgi:hypothetical protein
MPSPYRRRAALFVGALPIADDDQRCPRVDEANGW